MAPRIAVLSWRRLAAAIFVRLWSARHRDLLETIERVAKAVGAPVLQAKNTSEIPYYLDQQIENGSIGRMQELLVVHPRKMRPIPKWLFPVNVNWMGEAASAQFSMGMRHLERGAPVLIQLFDGIPDDEFESAFRHTYGSAASILEDPLLPVDLAEASLAAMRADVSVLALCEIARRGVSPEPWMAFSLARHFQEGQWDRLRILASLPGVVVPESDVPRNCRFDFDELSRQAREADERMRDTGDASHAD